MIEIRCGSCRRKLGEGIYLALSIKCPRCGALNQFQSAPGYDAKVWEFVRAEAEPGTLFWNVGA